MAEEGTAERTSQRRISTDRCRDIRNSQPRFQASMRLAQQQRAKARPPTVDQSYRTTVNQLERAGSTNFVMIYSYK